MIGRPIPPLVEEVLRRFAALMRERCGSRLLELRLFGSYARGEAHEASDVDVFVVLDEVSWADRTATLELAGDLWRESELLVSPVIMGREQVERWRRQGRPLVKSIDTEGAAI